MDQSLNIDYIGLSVRSMNALHRAKIHTLEDMLKQTPESLCVIRNIGKKSVDEITAKIEEIKRSEISVSEDALKNEPYDQDLLVKESPYSYEEQQKILSFLREQKIRIDALDLLSVRSYNLLRLNGIEYLHQFLFLPKVDLMKIPGMTLSSAEEILQQSNSYIQNELMFLMNPHDAPQKGIQKSVFELIRIPRFHEAILEYTLKNDRELSSISLSFRSLNQLMKNNYFRMSDIVFLTKEDLKGIRNLGVKSIEEIDEAIHRYLSKHEERILVALGGNGVVVSDDEIRSMILSLYKGWEFHGFSFEEIKEQLIFPEPVPGSRLKQIIGSLFAAGELEYVDSECFRLYLRFSDALEQCDTIEERNREFLRKRLAGATLVEIGQEYGLTRERVRQLIKKTIKMISKWYSDKTGDTCFDEEYYRYFYENYAFDKKEATEWFGIPEYVFRYFDLMDFLQGEKDLQCALEDQEGLEAGFRLRIKNYLYRNKLFLDGNWVEKRRADLERFVIKKYCKEDTPFREFVVKYNNFLAGQEITDESLLITESVYQTRKNRMSENRCSLWKLNETIRYYDIDGRDYGELFEALNLDSYKNTGLSTLKLFREYPDVMGKYDIRDQYELYNLLKKVIKEGDFHDLHFVRTPDIEFGVFDREAEFRDLLMENAPISMSDFCSMIEDRYGYDPRVTQGTYLAPFYAYYHQGVYRFDQKVIPAETLQRLNESLTEDFYFIEEIKKKYNELIPGADPGEINAYNLKTMGFTVLSGYVFRNYPSLDAYFTDLLTKQEIMNAIPFKRRFGSIQIFYQTFLRLRQNLELIEFEPNQFISAGKLEKSGITREMMQSFCDEVWDFIADGPFFSMYLLRHSGFSSDLFRFGFGDLFYGAILRSDNRFSYGNIFGVTIFKKGDTEITIRSFIEELVAREQSIDMLDLMKELTEEYGCTLEMRSDITSRISDSDLYYDSTLDRLYENEELFLREFDEAEMMGI